MSDTSERSPSLAELLERATNAAQRRIFRCRPGRVTKWDASKQKANVQPLIKIPYLDEEQNRQVESDAILTDVPVLFMGAGPLRITFPVSDGKLVIEGETIPATRGVIFWSEVSLDKWLATSDGKEVDPEFDHRDGHNDAVFIPGLNPFGDPLDDVPTDHMSVGFDGGLQIKIKKTMVEVGDKNATTLKLVAISDLVEQNNNNIRSALNTICQVFGTHTHEWAGFGSGTTDPPNEPMTNSYNPSDVSAKNLKAEQ